MLSILARQLGFARVRNASVLVLLATCLGGCPHPGSASDGGFSAHDAAPSDGALWPVVGTRLSLMRQVEPANGCAIVECPGCLPQEPVAAWTTLLLRLAPSNGGLLLRAGTGVQVSETPVAYSFVDRLEPIAVNVSVEETLVDAGVAQRFASRSVFVWHLDLIPDEPPLELRNATVGGFLNADSLPTSDLPPLSGTMSGCLSPTAADAVFIPTLSKTLREFLEGCSPLDCSTTNAGDADGWTLEFRWQAEVVTIRDGEIL